MDKYKAKEKYAEKKMKENSKVETLTEEQHDVLSWICKLRHNIHVRWDKIWCENEMEDLLKFDTSEESEVEERIKKAGLPELKLRMRIDMLPSDNWYYYGLSSSEREDWEQKAEEFNEKRGTSESGVDRWKEESGEYDTFIEMMNKFNEDVENYLREIDKIHGTNYCPTGLSRD